MPAAPSSGGSHTRQTEFSVVEVTATFSGTLGFTLQLIAKHTHTHRPTVLFDDGQQGLALQLASVLTYAEPLVGGSGGGGEAPLKPVLEVGRYETVCHTGTSLDGYKSYRHFRSEKYNTGTPQ